jgi:hypothetical protein
MGYETMKQYPYLYPDSASDAAERNEITMWRASFRANIACKQAIESSIRQSFDGMYLADDCAKGVIQEFGFKRVNFVLANTLQLKSYDERFSLKNREWGARFFIPTDPNHNADFAVNSHPAVLDGFIQQARQAYQELELFGPEHCTPNSRSELDYEGKVLVLSPDVLKEECWTPENQLWYAHDGFGCSPYAVGRSVRATCLGDGEMTRWNRADFVGVLEDTYLPDWAKQKLEELRNSEQTQESGPEMGEMTL